MRFFAASLLACVAAIALGCGEKDDSTPVACLEGTAVYEKALADAPGEVLIEGETPISDCLVRNQSTGDLTRVGEALIAAAAELNAGARQEPGGPANLQLGYLVGAAERGAEESEGIHTDLIRRLTVAARFAPGREPLSEEFLATYREGFDAGRGDG
jgi:hypothetical protein